MHSLLDPDVGHALLGVDNGPPDIMHYVYHRVHLCFYLRYAAAEKALSEGSAINYGTWKRGPAADLDRWAN
jgi:hypothetical protein